MQLGIFAKSFPRSTWQETLAAVKSHGLECLQFNCSCAGLPTVPEALEPTLINRIHAELKQQALSMAAVSGTCNLIHPDVAHRTKDLIKLQQLINACPAMGTSVVTLCSGTRDADDMWRWHAANDTPDAWRDLLGSLTRLLPSAERAEVVLGIEPEPANVIHSALKARKLIEELRSPCLKIVFDAANMVRPGDLARQSEVLDEAMDLLGADIVIAHAKDVAGGTGAHVAAGRGELDYDLYLRLLRRAGFDGPVILHSLTEAEVPDAVDFLRKHITRTRAAVSSR